MAYERAEGRQVQAAPLSLDRRGYRDYTGEVAQARRMPVRQLGVSSREASPGEDTMSVANESRCPWASTGGQGSSPWPIRARVISWKSIMTTEKAARGWSKVRSSEVPIA